MNCIPGFSRSLLLRRDKLVQHYIPHLVFEKIYAQIQKGTATESVSGALDGGALAQELRGSSIGEDCGVGEGRAQGLVWVDWGGGRARGLCSSVVEEVERGFQVALCSQALVDSGHPVSVSSQWFLDLGSGIVYPLTGSFIGPQPKDLSWRHSANQVCN